MISIVPFFIFDDEDEDCPRCDGDMFDGECLDCDYVDKDWEEDYYEMDDEDMDTWRWTKWLIGLLALTVVFLIGLIKVIK